VAPSSAAKPEAIPLLALQVTDEAKAKAALSKAKADSGEPLGVVSADGWLIVSDTSEHATAAQTAAKSSPLSSSAAFSDDVAALGDQGIASFWFDYAALGKLTQDTSGGGGLFGLNGLGSALAGQAGAAQLPSFKGHGAMALRFSGANMELAGKLRGFDLPMSIADLGAAKVDLPADSLAAFQVAGLGEGVAKAWPDLVKQLATLGKTTPEELTSQAEQATGLKLPADLRPLLGEQFGVALRGGAGGQAPEFGIRVQSSSPDTKRVADLVSKVAQDGGTQVTVRQFAGGYAIGSSAAQADSLAKGGGLAASERFKNAVPDADGAAVVLYVDLEKALALTGTDSMSEANRKSVAALQAVGFSVKQDGEGSESFALRLTTR
jgi:hypothetical protein